MRHFTHSGLTSNVNSKEDDVRALCESYDLDCIEIVRELNEFRTAYINVHCMVSVDDLLRQPQHRSTHDYCGDNDNSEPTLLSDEDNNDKEPDEDNNKLTEGSEERYSQIGLSSVTPVSPDIACKGPHQRWIDHSFIKPLRVLIEFSSYPHLTALYKILASIAVTSSSAERVLSRVRIIKNRLRTSMLDDWFSALTILASEADVTKSINIDEIIDSLANSSGRLREHLLY